MPDSKVIGGPYREALVTRADRRSRSNRFPAWSWRLMLSNTDALEFSEATEKYARLAKELVAFRKSAPYAEYEAKLLELEAARERCEKARPIPGCGCSCWRPSGRGAAATRSGHTTIYRYRPWCP